MKVKYLKELKKISSILGNLCQIIIQNYKFKHKTIMHDQLMEKLINQYGVNSDIKCKQNQHYYDECVMCSTSIFQGKFNVLGCGHLICTDCWQTQNKCMYPNCANKILKHTNLDMENLCKPAYSDSSIFRFMVMLPRSSRGIDKTLPLSAKLNDLINSQIERHTRSQNKFDYFLIINKKQVKLKEQKDLKLSEICKNHNIRLNDKGTNIVLLVQRQNGGLE